MGGVERFDRFWKEEMISLLVRVLPISGLSTTKERILPLNIMTKQIKPSDN
jgi:hypothetical protein